MEYIPDMYNFDNNSEHSDEEVAVYFGSPVIRLGTPEGEELSMHWLNSRVRLFKEDKYNHVEFTDEEDSLRAFKPVDHIMRLFRVYDFPALYLPIVDEATVKWYQGCQDDEAVSIVERLEAEMASDLFERLEQELGDGTE